MITEFFAGFDWKQFALGAAGVGAVALSGSRIMEFIDQWMLKLIRPGHRGYIVLFGWAVRYRWRGEVRLVSLYPGVYIQLFMLIQVKEFNVQEKPLPSSVGDQTVTHWKSGRTCRLRMNAQIQYKGDGRSALLSQIHMGDPDTIVRQRLAQGAIEVLNRVTNVNDISMEAFLANVRAYYDSFANDCGVAVKWLGVEDWAWNDPQIHKDGLLAVAGAIDRSGPSSS